MDLHDIDLDDEKLQINLELYAAIKNTIKAKLTKNQIIELIEKLKLIISSNEAYEEKLSNLEESICTLSKSENKLAEIQWLIDNTVMNEQGFIILRLALNLLRIKDLILHKSKLISEHFRATESIHIMDFRYDHKMLYLPYSVRVAGALLIKIIFEDIKNIVGNDSSIYEPIKSDLSRLKNIDPDAILQIIYAESANQSIVSSAGSSYEKRFEEVLISQGIKYMAGPCFDAKLTAVEYDFKLKVANKTIGVSAKRTLRERYKQNHEDISALEVDGMFLVTLGIDLNESKINNIIQKKGNFIFVASDIYNKRDYFQKSAKVFPLNKLTNALIKEILGDLKK